MLVVQIPRKSDVMLFRMYGLNAYSHNLNCNFEGGMYFSPQFPNSNEGSPDRERERESLAFGPPLYYNGRARLQNGRVPLSPRKRTRKEDRNVQVMVLFGRGRGGKGLQGPF